MTGSPVDLVLERIAQSGAPARRSGDGWQARCPAHDDSKPSLSVSAGADGRALITCHAGCDLARVLAALRLDPGDLFPDETKANGNGRPQITDTYDYLDEGGNLLFQVVRFYPKDFRQRRPNDDGSWNWKLGATRRVLYRLPQVIDAAQAGKRIWIVEGEKDVHALEGVGEVATCNPGGAGKWRTEYGGMLAGADVIVVADRDEPGRIHATLVATSLRPIARSVRMAEPTLGKDIAEHLGAGRTLEQLHYEDPPPPAEDAPDLLFRRWTTKELLGTDLTLRWTVQGALIHPTYGQIAGAMKTLKSYVGMFLDLAIATGTPFLGHFPVERAGPVVAYIGEGGRIPYTRRLQRVASAMGVHLQDAMLEVTFDVAPILSERFTESLNRDLEQLEPVLVHPDPLYAYHGTDTKASDLHQEGHLLSSASALCGSHGASLLFTNHFNQTGSGSGLQRITQAGSGEWVDSWLLTSHRDTPDVDNGRFKLLLEIGSRQWGGTTWELDLDIGHLDPETGTHDGDITWELRRHAAPPPKEDRTSVAVLEVLSDCPFELTKTGVVEKVGGNRDLTRNAFEALRQEGQIRMRNLPRIEGGRAVNRDVWALSTSIAPDELRPNPAPDGTP